jgi:CP family cyanate transporter-like MFS transporter
MAALTAGLALRTLAGATAGFLAASALALAGIAVGNVLLPVVVKRYFPDRVGTMTGLYSMAVSVGTAVAAATTVPLDHALGGDWRLGLGAWALLAAVALVPWLVLLSAERARRGAASPRPLPEPVAGGPAGAVAAGPVGETGGGSAGETGAGRAPRVTRSRTAWALAVFFGLQSTGAYVTMGWLPQIFRDAGVSADGAGLLLAVTMAISVPLSFVLPALAGRMRHQGGLAVALSLFGFAGYAGLWLAPAALPLLWALLLGMANCAFPLALTMIGMRSRSQPGVVRLSAFAQCTGYLLSIPGPVLVGALYQHTGGWGAPIALMVGLLVPQTAAGMLAGRDRHVEDEA